MLCLNPERQYQINTPVPSMLNIFIKSITDENSVHLYTISDTEDDIRKLEGLIKINEYWKKEHNEDFINWPSEIRELLSKYGPFANCLKEGKCENKTLEGIKNWLEGDRAYSLQDYIYKFREKVELIKKYPPIIEQSNSSEKLVIKNIVNSEDNIYDHWINKKVLQPVNITRWFAVKLDALAKKANIDTNYSQRN